jgi:hypothetical protein
LSRYNFGVIAGMGRLERIYFLTEQGAEVVADFSQRDPADIRYPRYGLRYQNDYFHRKAFIDVHIWLTQWVESHPDAELEFFNPYFIKDQNRRSINQFRFKPSDYRSSFDRLTIEPDGVFRVQKGETALLCAVEVHRKPDSKAILKQLDQHIDAMSADQNLIPERFDHHAPLLCPLASRAPLQLQKGAGAACTHGGFSGLPAMLPFQHHGQYPPKQRTMDHGRWKPFGSVCVKNGEWGK